MSKVQFILGRSGTGKTQWCLDAVCDALSTGGDEPLILLVPEQATYQAERAILSHPDIAGFSRLRILSFNRLEFWLSGGAAGRDMSHTGKHMVLHKLLLELADELSLYKGDIQRLGLASKLSGLIDELQRSNCAPEQLNLLVQTLAGQTGQELAAAKWGDIARIFLAYQTYFQSNSDGFVNPDVQLAQAKQKVANAPFLKNAKIWVDGFSGFSVQERDLLIELLKTSDQTSIALCLDPQTLDLNNADESKLDPCSLFACTEQTYCDLLRIIRGCKLTQADPVLLNVPMRFQDSQSLAAIEQSFIDETFSEPMTDEAVCVTACQNIRAEAMCVAAQIHSLVKDQKFRYRDIAVVVPDMNTYQHYIESAFGEYEFPYFLDRPRQMKTHPLVELIGSAMQAVSGGFKLSDILSFLKSPMTPIDFETADALENYCRAFEVSGSEWTQGKRWDYASEEDKYLYDEKSLDAIRREAIKPLVIFKDAMDSEKEMQAADFIAALWQLLESLNVQATLSQWAEDDQSDEQFGHRQLFGKVVLVAEEMCRIFTEASLGAEAWGSIFIDALSTLTIKLIPPCLDQVLVGSIERSRHPDVKAIFLIGATQKQFPIPTAGQMLLTEQDYQHAQDCQLELANPYEQQLTSRQYLAYIALTRASKAVYLSYPMLDEKGSAVVPWSGLEQLQKRFGVQTGYWQGQTQDAAQIQNPSQFSQWLSAQLGKDRDGLADETNQIIVAGVLDQALRSDDAVLKQAAKRVNTALAYENQASLSPLVCGGLFEFPLKSSVTRLGNFAACPYQYFAKYSLNLKRRKLLRFEPMDIGNFYHEVLEKMFLTLKDMGKDWADLDDDALIALCNELMENVIASNTQIANFIRRQTHHQYILEAAKDMLRRFVPGLAQLSRVGHFRQAEAELDFGLDKNEPVVMTLDDGRSVHLRGKIDRMDLADIKGKPAAIVFDYKRTPKTLNFTQALYGLDLQLPVYLLAICKLGSADAAGAFFLPIENNFGSSSLSNLDQTAGSFNKAKGLLDGAYATDIDGQVAPSKRSAFYNFALNKDGVPYSYYNTSSALKEDDFKAILDYTQAMVKKLAAELTSGCIEIKPYRLGKKSPCSYCDYKPLCRFDWQVNEYNILDTCNKDEALQKMKESQ